MSFPDLSPSTEFAQHPPLPSSIFKSTIPRTFFRFLWLLIC
jgi:hypothetical protein